MSFEANIGANRVRSELQALEQQVTDTRTKGKLRSLLAHTFTDRDFFKVEASITEALNSIKAASPQLEKQVAAIERTIRTCFSQQCVSMESLGEAFEALHIEPKKREVAAVVLTVTKSVTTDPRAIFGNKAAGQMEVEKLFTGVKGVHVPPFFPIAHAAIQSHLEAHYKEYKSDWKEFVQSLDKGTLTPKSHELLTKIQQKIEKVFIDHPFQDNAMEEFLKTKAPLMVRSSGKEDTEQLANAGGNISVAGVQPTQNCVSQAIGKVVASYHSPLSLTQRMLAQDDISQDPFTPVLVQTMIGEAPNNRDPAQIPISGVVYTREVLGRTDNLYQIQATYGHNEAVVMSELPVDTYYAYSDDTHHDVIRKKEHRLVADSQAGFQLRDNPKAMARAQALLPKKIEELQKISQKIHEFYKKPMDIEWVYDRAKEIFYIVQARPIVSRMPLAPSYLDTDAVQKVATSKESYKGEAIVSQAKVTVCYPSEVMYDTSLAFAFQRFWKLAQKNERPQVKAIVISKHGAATSHYACTLREMGVDVFYAKDMKSKELEGKDQLIVIAPQEGECIIVKTTQAKDAFTQAVTKPGWYRHPIAAIESLQKKPVDLNLIPTLFDSLLKGHKPQHPLHIQSTLRALSDPDKQIGNRAMKDMVAFAFRIIGRMKDDPIRYERGCAIFRSLALLAQRYITATAELERLHAAKRVEAFLLQEAIAEVVGTDSLIQLQKERALLQRIKPLPVKKTDRITAEQKRDAQALYHLVNKKTLREEIAKKWEQFSLQVAATGSAYLNRMLIDMIRSTQELGILDSWVSLHVVPCLTKNKNDMQATLRELYKEIDASKKVLQELHGMHKQLKHFQSQESSWSDPSKYKALQQSAELPLFEMQMKMSKRFIEKPPLPPLAKCAILHFLKDALAVHDAMIKAMRSSPQYTDKALQATRFQEMLRPYAEVMKFWVNQIPDSSLDNWLRASVTNEKTRKMDIGQFRQTVNAQIEHLLTCKREFTEKELRQSEDFHVNLWVVTNCTRATDKSMWSRIKTLEDLFMLIHQNSLAALSSVEQVRWDAILPEPLQRLHSAVMTIDTSEAALEIGSGYKPNLLDASFLFPALKLQYNIPLSFHSAFIDIEYNVKSQEAEFQLRISGGGRNEDGRFEDLSHDLFIQCMGYGIPIDEMPNFDEMELRFACRLTGKELLSQKIDSFTRMLVRTLAATQIPSLRFYENSPNDLVTIDNDNPATWNTLCQSKERVANWVEKFPQYHLHTLIQRLALQGWHEQFTTLFKNLGFQFEPSNKDTFLLNTFKGIICALPHPLFVATPSCYVREMNVHVLCVSSPTCRLFLDPTCVDAEGAVRVAFYQSVLENRGKILFKSESAKGEKMFVAILQKIVMSLLFLRPDNLAKEYVDFLIANKQWETLAEIYYHPLDAYTDLTSMPLSLSQYIGEALKGQLISGYEVDATTKARFKQVEHFRDIVVGQTVCFEENGIWLCAKVVRVAPEHVILSARSHVPDIIWDKTKLLA